MSAKSLLRITSGIAWAALSSACSSGAAGPATISGVWQAAHIEWDQGGRKAKLTIDGHMHLGRVKLPTQPASFDPIIQTMQNVTIQVSQSGGEFRGTVTAGSAAPASVLRQIGAQPGSVLAEFEGQILSSASGSVVVTTADGRRRSFDLRIEEGGRRIVAFGVPVFGETAERAGDVLLVPTP